MNDSIQQISKMTVGNGVAFAFSRSEIVLLRDSLNFVLRDYYVRTKKIERNRKLSRTEKSQEIRLILHSISPYCDLRDKMEAVLNESGDDCVLWINSGSNEEISS